jgi:hypothetical protein
MMKLYNIIERKSTTFLNISIVLFHWKRFDFQHPNPCGDCFLPTGLAAREGLWFTILFNSNGKLSLLLALFPFDRTEGECTPIPSEALALRHSLLL